MTQTATNNQDPKPFIAHHDSVPGSGAVVAYKAVVAQLIRSGTTLRAVLDMHDFTTSDTPDITSVKYPDLTEAGVTISAVGVQSDGRAYFEWDPSTMPAAIADAATVDAGDTYAVNELASQIIFRANNIQIDGQSTVTVTMYGRTHQHGGWLQLGQWIEGTDTFPIIVEFDAPLSQVKVVGSADTFQVYAQR